MTDEQEYLDYLKRVTIDLRKTRRRLEDVERREHEPIAIVGMSCRYPGGVSCPEGLWEVVSEGRDEISQFPSDRGWHLEGLFDPDPDHPGTTYTREGGFLSDVGHFDAEFFGISPREALAMDPQHRLLLECSWEAIEYGEIDPASMSGSDTGVFVGVMYHDYGMRLVGSVPQDMEAYLGLGSAGSVASGRVAYSFGFQGPAVTVDTACSSSLVAMHLACGALRRGECSMALAGGVTVLSTPGVFVEFARQRGLAGDGRCKPYADAADGTGWSEGIGMLALERLSDAQNLGHHVLAVIRGSAVNQDGASNGLTAPNGPSQQRVIRQALANAGLTPAAIDAVEGHGTGTTLGDPIEAQALLVTYGRERPEREPLWLGSVKSNIGHTQAAAGVAGVIKMVMAMRAGVLPRTLHVDEPSRQVDWSNGAVALLTQNQQWDRGEEPRRAGVSSFGVSGTNAHVILEQAPADPRNRKPVGEGEGPNSLFVDLPLVPWVISGHGPDALRAQSAQLLAHVVREPDLDIGDVGHALARRSRFNHRAVVLGADRKELLEGLSALAQGDSAANLASGVGSGDRQVVFLFPGQGSQWAGMALELLEESPVFAEHMSACADALAPFTDWSLLEVLRGSEQAPGLDRVDVVQPVLFAVMVSLAELWRACGVRPAAVVGHSQGEVAAAYIAGGLTLQDAACVVALRSRALQEVAWQGGTVSVSLPAEEVAPLLGRWGDLLCVAAVNGPRSVAVSGDPDALVELLVSCDAQGIRARKIEMNFAAHSSQMDPLREGLLEGLADIAPHPCEIPFHSTVTGEPIDAAQLDARYWYRNLREPVQLESVIRRLLSEGHRSFVEVSPHPVLIGGVQETIDDFDASPGSIAVTGSLRRGEGDVGRFLRSLADVFVHGTALNWERVIGGGDALPILLPTYAFQRSRYWLDAPSGAVAGARASGARPTDHPLLNAALTIAADRKWLFTGRLSLQTHPWLADHTAMGKVLLPGSALLELALHAGAQLDCAEVHELTLQAPLMISKEGETLIQISVGEPDELGARTLNIHSRAERPEGDEPGLDEETWIGNAEGVLMSTVSEKLGTSRARARPEVELSDQMWPPKDAVALDIEDLYAHLSEHGLDYGPAFQGLQAVWRRGDELFAEVALPEVQREQASRFGLHPALLDAALHAAGVTELGEELGAPEAQVHGHMVLPFSWSGVRVSRAGAVSLRAQLVPIGPNAMSLAFFDEYGEKVASVRSLTLRPVSAQQLDQAGADEQRLLLGVNWTPPTSVEVPSVESIVLLGADSQLALAAKNLDLDIHSDLSSLTEAIEQGLDAPDVVIVDWVSQGREAQLPDPISSGLSDATHAAVKHALGLAQEWIANEPYADSRLVLVTHGAMCTDAGEGSPDPVGASIWGLIGSAISEHPDRFCLVDLDGEPESSALLRTALASGEPKLAVRKGKLLVPRLVRIGAGQDSRDRDSRLALEGTVLITGGTGKLGGFVAKHLVAHYGVPSVLLVSRAGRQADGAAQLERELLELGARVAVEACDVTDRAQLAGLIDGLPHDFPLRAVVHAAGLLDDGVIESLTPDRVDRVLEPKVDAAWHLHELTRELDLSAFVMFSSFSGVLGSPGQGNYAAANVFMDALAAARGAQGLAAVSIAWGLWGHAGGLTGELGEADLIRLAKSGMRAMSEQEGLQLFDAALRGEQTQPVALCLDAAALRAQAKAQALPPLLHGLVHVPMVRATEDRGRQFVQRLRSLPSAERESTALETVSVEVAAVLGHSSSRAIDPQRPFKELGFDSLMAVELRNRLGTKTGLRLPATLVFDYPNPVSLATRLLEEIDGASVELAAVRSARIDSDEPIAIVGMACRYPGGVSSPDELWELVTSGGDAISGFPDDRGWDLRALYDPDPDRLGTTYTREGGFVRDALEFDAGFFDISPREALAMDPQQRLLLESSWEALEHAGIDPLSLHGSQTGVFGGVMYSDYGARLLGMAPSDLEGYIGTGSAGSVASGRVAYALGLEGPAVTIDTACSSSLVAMHLACGSLRDGECSLALAGGVTVLSNPHVFVAFSRQRGLAPDGRCKSFAEEADGTGWAEGAGVLVLERLSQAQHRGHRVLALIRGSAINQDGASNGLTAPNGPSQQRVIR
ncbi:MAG TPA: type I polyketide synthase, partial [Solirubrobacteraceae bacterium]|nr:type I polyketide synthase [Solirubrobacteraceae bacterium]